MEKILDILALCPLFFGIRQEDMGAMLSCLGAKQKSFSKGEIILGEGAPAELIGVVLSGMVQVVREDYFGNRSMMAKLGPAEMFAEAFALAGVEGMPVNVVAAENSEVMLIDVSRISRPCAKACGFHQQMIYNLMRILALKNLACNQKIEVVSRRSTREKLMAYLLLQAKRAKKSTFLIPFDRQELADYLEVDRSGLSTEIGKLRREGVIDCEKNRFTIKTPL